MKNWKQSGPKNERKKQERRKKREIRKRQAASAKLSQKLIDRLEEAYSLIQDGDYDEAEALLMPFDRPGSGHCEVLEALLILYQTKRAHERCSDVAARLVKLSPRDANAHLSFAQASMFCGRVAIAMTSYQEFIDRWPEHEYATNAKNALELLVPEVENKIRAFGFPKEHAVAWTMLHEQALSFVQRGDFLSCATKCEELLALAPDFAPARNNLAIAYFQTGRPEEALGIVETTRKLTPASRFAEATLAKLYFLTGREPESQRIATHLVADPPNDPDSMTVTLETLAYLGRDEDIVALEKKVVRNSNIDKTSLAMDLHYLAYAKCRLGDEKGARAHWKKCLALCPNHSDALENLLDLDTGGGHAPWAASFDKWVPKEQIDKAVQRVGKHNADRLLVELPTLTILIPALLDRGDPLGREFAARFAMFDDRPQSIEALSKFAFGLRGPDKLRFEVLLFLQKSKVVDAGPHQFYSKGQWSQVLVHGAEITSGPELLNYPEHVREILEDGSKAQQAGDFNRAETIYKSVLAEDPNNCTAIYNTCVIWLNRDGEQGRANAFARLTKLHSESPSYLMAPLALAQLAADDGDLKTAHDLLTSVYNESKLSYTEALALFTAQIQIAILEKKLDAAQLAFEALLNFADPDDRQIEVLRRRIDLATSKNPLRRLISSSFARFAT